MDHLRRRGQIGSEYLFGRGGALKVEVIDCRDPLPQFSSVYLLHEPGQGTDSPFALVDCHSAHSFARVEARIAELGLKRERLEWLFITHAHLDHAGGAWQILREFPNAKMAAHPKAARHLIDPSRLNQSARAVYGDALFDQWYGDLRPIDPARVRVLEDGETLSWNGFSFRVLHTRGHANHHLCLHEVTSNVVFTGDSFGLSYPALPGFYFPSTSPTDFDANEARTSYDRIVATGARTAYPTHFGGMTDLPAVREQLLPWIELSSELLDEVISRKMRATDVVPFLEKTLGTEFVLKLKKKGLDPKKSWPYIEGDLRLNARGLAFVAQKKLETSHGSNQKA